MVHENNELRHKVVYIGSRCEQVESELIQTKEYLNSEVKKANERTDQAKKEKVIIILATLKITPIYKRFLGKNPWGPLQAPFPKILVKKWCLYRECYIA